MPAKTLVTGGAGFIGSAVVRQLLAQGREVRCLVEPGSDRRNLEGLDVEQVDGLITDRQGMRDALRGCDVMYHLAAIYRLWLPDPQVIYDVNVEGSKTVLFAALEAGLRKVIFTSSIAALGVRADGQPADETVDLNFWADANDYIRTKFLSDRDARRFAGEGLPVVLVNPAFPFGERDVAPTPTGRLVCQVLRGEMPAFPEGGFNAVDVEDVARAHLLAEEKGQIGQRYIAGGHNVTWQGFFAKVAELGGVKPPKVKLPAKSMARVASVVEWVSDHVTHAEPRITRKDALMGGRRYWFDNTKARTELGLQITPLDDTLERSIRWFRGKGYC
jgi:dihydroflavonol-4-reductase